ncbi:MAG TPA: ABC transporter permease, partial [Vicinamibacterales bacterium]|nr:ABC transporter permease [Vicinamibacterales bacterium]
MTAMRRALARFVIVSGTLIAEAGTSLATRRLQATLSAVGIGTGIAGVVLLVAVISGLDRFVLAQIHSAGGNVLEFAAEPHRGLQDPRHLPTTLRLGDEAVVLATSEYFDLASAENSAALPIVAGDRVADGLETRGLTSDGFAILQLRARGGRTFLPEEQWRGARVAVLGAAAARTLFGSDSPLGQCVRIGGWPFVVVGELAWVGDPDSDLRSRLDDVVYVPFRAAAEAFHGEDAISSLRFRLRSMTTEAAAVREARAVLDRQRRLRGETGGELKLRNTIEQARLFNRLTVGLRILSALVGAIGLIVGAVGVTNVLVASVRERANEIGIRRALGATRRSIYAGLLFEALAITLAGGLVGLLVAWSLSKVAILIPLVPVNARPHVSWATSAAVFVGLVMVGLIAGIG